ncbi:M23 family metallopeptidase [Vibrio sp. JC009]|uniref:M23 family metallopeptidase n=1 Tax=Vibrio sp. JC009 TaxID=2912314 RepID=UPI0023AEF6BC|nr:M23 family metallopeptidase [Vibrio sp. JC009]WED23131.1 M23 family metallopeptidase [Vibrio sp. JC009]
MNSESLIVTISGVKGTNHFRLTKKAITRLKILLVALLVTALSVATVVLFLLDEVTISKQAQSTLEQRSKDLNEELVEYEQLQEQLKQQVVAKEQELENMNDRLNDIESVLGTSSNELDIDSRLDLAAVNTVVRQQILRMIPNGSPVKTGYISSGYGMRTHPVTKKRSMHRGIDLAVNTGTPIYAPADGVVEVTRKSNQGSGNYLRLMHSFGITSSYSHLKAFKVKNGDFVQKGDLIGLSGNTGLSAGAHLHYEVRFIGRSMNPRPFVNWSIDNFESIFKINKGIKWDYLIKRVEQQVSTTLQLSSQKAQ